MIIQKLRLENGWSQQQLADMSGLSKRTIQRIENGQTPSAESVKSLAAVFEVDFSTLNGALAMNNQMNTKQPKNQDSIGNMPNNTRNQESNKKIDTAILHDDFLTAGTIEVASTANSRDTMALTPHELRAYKKIRDVKKFYMKLAVFIIVIAILFFVNLIFSPEVWWVQWVFLGWGIGLLRRALQVFQWLPLFGAQWEKRQLEKYLKER